MTTVLTRSNLRNLAALPGWLRERGVAAWCVAVPVVAGRDPSPFQRVVAAADFVNGISSPVPAKEWTFINPDLTVTVHRLPVGEWVALDAGTRVDGDGTGTAEADLYDASGRLGRAVQTLLVEHR